MEDEIKKLKEMLSIHLDIVQHQVVQSSARETQMKLLKRENDLLLQKMERMERRMAAQQRSVARSPQPPAAVLPPLQQPPAVVLPPLQQPPAVLPPLQLQPAPRPALVDAATSPPPVTRRQLMASSRFTQTSPRAASPPVRCKRARLSIADDDGVVADTFDDQKRDSSPPRPAATPATPTPTPTPVQAQRRKRGSAAVPAAAGADSRHRPTPPAPTRSLRSSDPAQQPAAAASTPTAARRTEPADPPPPPPPSLPTPTAADVTPRAVRGRPTSVSAASATPSPVTARLPRKDFRVPHTRKCLMTEREYYVPPHPSPAADIVTTSEQRHIEVPRWQLRQLSPLYTLEGIEALADDVFLKRHSKMEADEKRRKRWDMQRLREQQAYEKLRLSYRRRNGGADCASDPVEGYVSAVDSSALLCHTLRPQPTSDTFIQVAPLLPVSAFGFNLPPLKPSEFRLPWAPVKNPLLPRGSVR